MDEEKREASKHLEHLMIDTPFPQPFSGADIRDVAQMVGLKVGDGADVSQEQLASIWLALQGRVGPKSGAGFDEQKHLIGLFAHIAYLTLLIRLTKGYLAGQVSGSIFTRIHFDWSLHLNRYHSAAGLGLSSDLWREYDNLRDRVDMHPELEEEKRTHGIDDKTLRSVAKRILEILEQFWAETKRKLMTSS